MGLDDGPHDRQPQPRAATAVAGTANMKHMTANMKHTTEGLEDVVAELRRLRSTLAATGGAR